MAPWKKTMSTVLLLILGSISTNVHANIMKTPSSGIFLEGSDVTLSCVVQDNEYVIWEEDATTIFVGKEKNTRKEKYDNFEISSADEDFSLIIKDVHLSDEGTYICKDQDQLANATVIIAVLPTLHIYVKESEAMHVPHISKHVNITCSAYNARPAVSVFELSVIGSETTMNITNVAPNQNGDGKTYNSSATVPFIMSFNDISVHCRTYTAGQWLNHTEKFNLPICNIIISGSEVRCTCQANPPVDTYRMELNGNLQDGDVLLIEESNSANITCFGTNEMGTGRSSILFPGNKAGFGILSIVVTISVAAVLIVLAVIYIKRRFTSTGKKTDEEQPNKEETNELLPTPGAISHEEKLPEDMKEEQPNKEETNELLPTPGAISHEEKLPEDMKDIFKEFQQYKVEVSAIISSEWDLFAIDALGLEVTEVLEIINRKPPIKDQVSEVWRLWENPDDSKNTKQRLMETIKKNSKDFASILNLNDNSNNTAGMTSGQQQVDDSSAEDLPQQDHGIMNKLLSEFITNCGGHIGIVGAQKMNDFYFPSNMASLREAKQIPQSLGVEFLNHLIDKGKLFPTYHSFNLLAAHLRTCNLHRACNALRTCLNETELSKYEEEWLTFASSSINQDWEIFGYEQLGLTDNEILDIIEVTDDLQKQVRLAFEKWIEKSKLEINVTSKTLIEVLTKSKPFDKHATNLGESGTHFKPTQTSPFSMVFSALDSLIGSEGQARLFQSYSKTKECKINVFEYLMQTGRLEDNQQMLAELCKKLKECHLLRAWNRLQSYTTSNTYEKLLSNVSRGMECDWELFAITDLHLKETEVYEIITRENTVEAQIRSALDLWSNKNECKQYETLLNLVLNSSVCRDTDHNSCLRKLSGDQGVNTGSDVDDQHIKDTSCKRSQNPDDAFREMIQSVSVMIGNTGAFYLLQQYTDACDQNEVKEKDDRFQKKEFDGEIFLKYLMECERLSDKTESLETFRIRLTESNLYRVRDKLDEYISQKQNKESNDDRLMDPNSSYVLTKAEKGSVV